MSRRKFEEALRCATRWHARRPRKGTRVPYVAHLLGAASLVLEDGGSTAEAIAALLHVAVEDRGGRRRLAEIRVSLADKLHNARAILADRRRVGSRIWRRFNAPRKDMLWYYRAVARCFERRRPGAMAAELSRCVRAMGRLEHRQV